MNDIQIFKHEQFGNIRTANESDKILFCARDIANALGYANSRKAINDHCKGVTKRYTHTEGGTQEMSFIPEGDVYRLIAHSKLPAAERFETWVFDEVLPTIRKTGGYVSNDEMFLDTYLPNADKATRSMFSATLATIKNLNSKIEADKPKVLFADAVAASDTSILVGELAKLIKQNGVDIGQNRLFTWMRDKGYLTKSNEPTQRSMDMKLFEVVERTVNSPDGSVKITRTTKVTGKGQTYFVNKFLSRKNQEVCTA